MGLILQISPPDDTGLGTNYPQPEHLNAKKAVLSLLFIMSYVTGFTTGSTRPSHLRMCATTPLSITVAKFKVRKISVRYSGMGGHHHRNSNSTHNEGLWGEGGDG